MHQNTTSVRKMLQIIWVVLFQYCLLLKRKHQLQKPAFSDLAHWHLPKVLGIKLFAVVSAERGQSTKTTWLDLRWSSFFLLLFKFFSNAQQREWRKKKHWPLMQIFVSNSPKWKWVFQWSKNPSAQKSFILVTIAPDKLKSWLVSPALYTQNYVVSQTGQYFFPL